MADSTDFYALLPFAVLLVGSALTFFAGRYGLKANRALNSGVVATGTFAVALYAIYWLWQNPDRQIFEIYGNVVMDAGGIGGFLALMGVSMGLLAAVYSIGYLEGKEEADKFFALLVLMVAGIVGIGFSTDLFNLFVFFELMSIASFALVAFERDERAPVEAGVKYIILSGAGSALALVGVSMMYAATGTTSLSGIAAALASEDIDAQGKLPVMGLLLMVVGFGVKSAMVPLHTWLPDAHSAAPSGISAMLSGIVIQGGLVMMLKAIVPFLNDGPFVTGTNDMPDNQIGLALAVMAVITMTAGNLMALKQKDLKRMLAYSSIAQMGYMLMGFGLYLYMPGEAQSGLYGGLLHIVTHAFMKGGAFLCAGAIIYAIGTRDLDSMKGYGRHDPLIGGAFAIFAFSLAGVPPFSGFISELFLVRAGIDVANTGPEMRWALIFTGAIIVNSVISLGYYMPAINKLLFAGEMTPRAKKARKIPLSMKIPIVAMAVLTVAIGVYPNLALWIVEPAADWFNGFLGAAGAAGGV